MVVRVILALGTEYYMRKQLKHGHVVIRFLEDFFWKSVIVYVFFYGWILELPFNDKNVAPALLVLALPGWQHSGLPRR